MKRILSFILFALLSSVSITAQTPPVEVPKAVVTPAVRYILTLELSQSRVSLDLSSHMKDAMNTTSFQLPVDEQFYNDVKVGTVLNKNFRSGSFLMSGSFGSWKVKVIKKQVVTE